MNEADTVRNLDEITSIELARMFAERGEVDKAAAILMDLIGRQERSFLPEAVTQLARIAYDVGKWDDAQELWSAATLVDPENLEAFVKLSHCLVELGRTSEAHLAHKRAGILLAQQTSMVEFGDNVESKRNFDIPASNQKGSSSFAPAFEPTIDDLLKSAYRQVCGHFVAGNLQIVKDLLEITYLDGSYSARVADVSQGRPIEPLLDEGEIRARMVEAQTAFQTGKVLPLGLKRLCEGAGELPIVTLKGKKIFLVMRTYVFAAGSREHEMTVFLRRSAEALGMVVIHFPWEAFFVPNEADRHAALDDLVKNISKENPDIIIFDHLCDESGSEHRINRDVLRGVFSKLRSRVDFKLVGLYLDSWTQGCIEAIEFASSFADVIWHQNSQLLAESDQKTSKKGTLFYSPFPYLEDCFVPANSNREIGAAFVGGLANYNLPRGIWLSLIKVCRLPCEVMLSTHLMAGNAAGDSVVEYAQFLSKIRIMANFAARNPTTSIMTGRTWESILSGCLLLEEDNPETRNFLIPYVHYFPFRNIKDLAALLQFFLKNENLRAEISERALAWHRQWYSKERIWSALFRAAKAV